MIASPFCGLKFLDRFNGILKQPKLTGSVE